MFGGQDDNAQTPQVGGDAPQDGTLNGVTDLVGGSSGASLPAPSSPAEPAFMSTPSEPTPPNTPTADEPEESDQSEPASSPEPQTPAADNSDLMDLKQQALQQLSPLVGHLDQTPEEKSRTTMMLIQASDNQALLKDAYEAAQVIEDEKAKAQALLDVINEINYFTQNNKQN